MCINPKTNLTTALLVILSITYGFAQNVINDNNLTASLTHTQKTFSDESGKVFWNAALPVYLSIASKPEGESYALKEMKTEKMKEFGNPMYFDGHGVHYIRHLDYESHIPEQEVAFAVHVDGRKPVSSVNFLNTSKYITNGRVFFGKDLKVDLAAKDEMSGLENIYFSVNNNEFKIYNQELKFDSQAEFDLKFYSVDKVGNIEEVHELKFEVDLDAPVTSYNVEGDMEGNTLSSRSKIVLSAQDNLSGVKRIKYKFDNATEYTYSSKINLYSLAEGEHTLTYYGTDRVDNVEEVHTYTFFLDTTPPEITTEVIGDAHEIAGKTFVSERTKLKISATDNKAGLSKIYYAIDGKGKNEYSAPFDVSGLGSGNHTIAYMAIDKVDNKTKYKTDEKFKSLNYDKTAPKLSHAYMGAKFYTRDTMFITNETKIKLVASDYQSGVQKITYVVDATNENSYTDPFTISRDGFHKLTYAGVDNVNNVSEDGFMTIVDSEGPEIFHHMSIDQVGTQRMEKENKTYAIYSKHAKLYLAATDKMVGTKKIYYAIDGGVEKLYSSAITTARAGLWKVKVRAIDQLGNTTELESIEFVIQ